MKTKKSKNNISFERKERQASEIRIPQSSYHKLWIKTKSEKNYLKILFNFYILLFCLVKI